MPLETSQTGIEDNLRFLIVEVKKQVERTRDYLRSSAPEVKGAIISRDDYIDNLKAMEFTLTPDQMDRLNKVAKFDLGFPLDFIGVSYETCPWVNWVVPDQH